MWHTHLKKKLNKTTSELSNKRVVVSKQKIKRSDSNSSTITESECTTSSSDFSFVDERKDHIIKSEDIESMEEEPMPEIDESFWSEAAALDETSTDMPSTISNEIMPLQYPSNSGDIFPQENNVDYNSNIDDGMDFWYDIFIRTGDQIELPEF